MLSGRVKNVHRLLKAVEHYTLTTWTKMDCGQKKTTPFGVVLLTHTITLI